MTRIGVLETGRPPEELSNHKDYPGMVSDWLADVGTEFTGYAVLDGNFPGAPEDQDLWVITGSKHGVYEDHAWIPPLEDFIRACHAARVPMFGICFGHQIIAQAMGADVDKSDKGWGLGVHEYPVRDWPVELGDAPDKIRLQAVHQDQVLSLPEGAEIIAATPFCEYAALWYPGWAITVQGHPEYDKSFAKDLMKLREGTIYPPDLVQAGMETQSLDPNAELLAQATKRALLKG